MTTPVHLRIQMANMYAAGGETAAIANVFGVSDRTVRNAAVLVGVQVRKGRPKARAVSSRDDNIKRMFIAGCTMQQIGDRHGVSRERVRQILERKHGIFGADGGKAKQQQAREQKRAERLDELSMKRWGMPFKEARALRRSGVTRLFESQRNAAKNRAIPWKLTLAQWWQMWQESGRWESRGRGKGKYCLARLGDAGAYEIGNVWVCEFAENCREAISHAQRGSKGNVHCLYPGLERSWVAKHNRKTLGRFATREEAEAAKRAYVEQLN